VSKLRPIMVVGCSSSAGKSLLVTALARWFARQGVDVAPFKALNMSNNARVVQGGEIGVAQWLQALAAGVTPTTSMNPVLLKPEADDRSQVVVNGHVRHDLTTMPWTQRSESLWPAMTTAFDELSAAHQLVVIEGAGSPAEINLEDLANTRIMHYADAAGLLVVDIDRGGAFAHLFGTWSLVPTSTRDRLSAFVLNKFRGDAELLAPAPAMLETMTSMRNAGVLRMLDHDLPDEEGATLRARSTGGTRRVGIVRYPFASNLDEFHLLAHASELRWITDPRDVVGCDLVILPGSKHVAADLAWLETTRISQALAMRVSEGLPIIGICGGCMMLGERIIDTDAIEGGARGLGILALETTLEPDKIVRPVTIRFEAMPSPFGALEGLRVSGYEIRHGRVHAACELSPLVWGHGAVLGTTVHGIFENEDVLEALCSVRVQPVLASTFNLLADAVDEQLDTQLLRRMVGLP
jgi:adenosylcobyric acid synthase